MSKSLDIDEELEKGRKFGNQTFIKNSEHNLLVVTRGHPFERDPFFEMIDSLSSFHSGKIEALFCGD